MIKKEQIPQLGIKQEIIDIDDDDDEILLLPDASLFNSNRSGGRGAVKQEIKEEVVDEDDDVNIVHAEGHNHSLKKVHENAGGDDLFSDVFKTRDDHSALLGRFHK